MTGRLVPACSGELGAPESAGAMSTDGEARHDAFGTVKKRYEARRRAELGVV